MLIDSHCHLDYYKKEELEQIISNAKNAGVKLMQTIGTEFSKMDQVLAIANQHPFIYASVGTHPDSAHEDFVTAEQIIEMCKNEPKIIGIGETGLDYYHSQEFTTEQKACFIEHIKASQETGKPIIIHTRNADDDTLQILKENLKIKEFKILMHCFTGGVEFVKKLLELGAFISFSGIVTFKNAKEVQESMMATPLNRLLIETDAPFLAPNPMRGKQNEPAFIKYTAEFIAQQKGLTVEALCLQVEQNFNKLFF